jgi:hypothetical protein
MLSQLQFAAEAYAPLAGSRTAVVGAFDDAVPLVLRQGGQEGEDAAVDGLG